MPLPKIEDARKMNSEELADAVLAAKRELFELRLQQATRRLEKPHKFKHVKHRIAQMMTVIQERKHAALIEQEAKATTASSPASTEPENDASQSDQQEE